MSARVYDFTGERTCLLCVHFIEWDPIWRDAGRCELFDKAVRHPDAVAASCSSYEPVGRHVAGQ